MRKQYRKWTAERISAVLEDAAATSPAEAMKKHGVVNSQFYNWKRKYAAGTLGADSHSEKAGPAAPNGTFQPQTDQQLAESALEAAYEEANKRGIPGQRFVADLVRFALTQLPK